MAVAATAHTHTVYHYTDSLEFMLELKYSQWNWDGMANREDESRNENKTSVIYYGGILWVHTIEMH